MTFKYLYCISQHSYTLEDNFNFENCHIPLDSYILKWYYRSTKDTNIIKWNSIKSYDEYNKIRKNILNLIPKGYTPLQFELLNWSIEKLQYSKNIFTTNSIISNFLIYKLVNNNDNLKTETVFEDCTEILKNIALENI